MPLTNPYLRLFVYHLDKPPTRNPWEQDRTYLGCWIEAGYAFLFFSEPAIEKVRIGLGSPDGPVLLDEYEMSYEEWQGGLEIGPIRVGRLIIYPYWQTCVQEADCMAIAIDPGLVFGTGSHPTTLDSLNALDEVFSRDHPRIVVDLGTGTGILALAAAKLGAEKVIAIDLNPLCVRTARANTERNGLCETIWVSEDDAVRAVEYSADLAIANMHMTVIEKLLAVPSLYQKKWVILSGLMRSQAQVVEHQFLSKRSRIVRRWESEGTWTTFLIKNSLTSTQPPDGY